MRKFKAAPHAVRYCLRLSSFSSTTKQPAEEEFLHAAEFGDLPTVKRLLSDHPELNADCIDALGRTALRLAVKNEHLEVGS